MFTCDCLLIEKNFVTAVVFRLDLYLTLYPDLYVYL